MAETTDQVKDEIWQTRQELAMTIDEIGRRLDHARSRIPFYGMNRRRALTIAGAAGASIALVFLALQVSRRWR